MNQTRKRLTLGILTYNNPVGLQAEVECVLAHIKENPELEELVEILISDNSDNEKTKNIVQSLFADVSGLVYIHNEKNIGFDRNVDQVLTKAQGLFCWTLSDNDLIAEGGIKSVVSFIGAHQDVAHLILNPNKAVTDIMIYENAEAMLKEHGDTTFVGGLISQNIFNTSFLPENRSQYYDNQWFHLSTALEVGSGHAVGLIPNVLKENIDDECRWAKNGHTFITYTCLHRIAMNLKEFGYSNKFLEDYHRSFLRGLPHQVVTAKLYGLTCDTKSIKRLYQHTQDDKGMFLVCLVLLVTPVFMFKLARYIWKKL